MSIFSFWSRDREVLLRMLHAEGLSSTQIRDRMGAPTRNTIIGKLFRLGLPGKRKSEETHRQSNINKKRISKFNFARQKAPPSKARDGAGFVNSPPSQASPALPSLDVMLLDLQIDQCRFPQGDRAPFKFCGQPTKGDSSWCGFHQRIVFLPIQTWGHPS